MSYFPTGNVILNANSTTTSLDDGETFTGVAVDVSRYDCIVFAVLTDTTTVVQAQFSPDGTNWDSSLTYNVAAGINDVHRLTVTRRYFRLVISNSSGSNQTYLRSQSMAGSFPQLASPLNLSVQQDADSIVSRGIDPELDIASGRLSGYTTVNKFGKNSDVDTGTLPEDVWETGGEYTGFPTTGAETITVVSSSASDTSDGVGLRTVLIIGLDASGNVQTETVTLNGTSGATTSNTFLRLHTALALTSGSSLFNVGTVTFRHTTTTANVFLNMQPNRNQTNSAGYTIPAGKTGYLRRIHGAIRGGNSTTLDGALWVRSDGGAPRLRRPFTIGLSDRLNDVIYGGIRITELTDMHLRITTTSGNNISVAAGFDLVLVDN